MDAYCIVYTCARLLKVTTSTFRVSKITVETIGAAMLSIDGRGLHSVIGFSAINVYENKYFL
jgi:hypothetical protein